MIDLWGNFRASDKACMIVGYDKAIQDKHIGLTCAHVSVPTMFSLAN